MQTSTSGPTYLSAASTRFIPASQIQDIWIHEAFTGFEVRFYLAIVVEGEDDVVVVFPVSLYFEYSKKIIWFLVLKPGDRNYCRNGIYWRKSGAEQKLVCMVLRPERKFIIQSRW